MKNIKEFILESNSEWLCKNQIAKEILNQFVSVEDLEDDFSKSVIRKISNAYDSWVKKSKISSIDDLELITNDDDWEYGDKVIVDTKIDFYENDELDKMQDMNNVVFHDDNYGITIYASTDYILYIYDETAFITKVKK